MGARGGSHAAGAANERVRGGSHAVPAPASRSASERRGPRPGATRPRRRGRCLPRNAGGPEGGGGHQRRRGAAAGAARTRGRGAGEGSGSLRPPGGAARHGRARRALQFSAAGQDPGVLVDRGPRARGWHRREHHGVRRDQHPVVPAGGGRPRARRTGRPLLAGSRPARLVPGVLLCRLRSRSRRRRRLRSPHGAHALPGGCHRGRHLPANQGGYLQRHLLQHAGRSAGRGPHVHSRRRAPRKPRRRHGVEPRLLGAAGKSPRRPRTDHRRQFPSVHGDRRGATGLRGPNGARRARVLDAARRRGTVRGERRAGGRGRQLAPDDRRPAEARRHGGGGERLAPHPVGRSPPAPRRCRAPPQREQPVAFQPGESSRQTRAR